MAGEIEMIGLTEILQLPIIVLDKHYNSIMKYGMQYQRAPLFLQYTSDVADVGHFNCAIMRRAEYGKCIS